MMRAIELMGPSGVGKSTLYDALRRHRPHGLFRVAEQVETQWLVRRARQERSASLALRAAASQWTRTGHRLSLRLLRAQADGMLADEIEQWGPLLAVWRRIAASDELAPLHALRHTAHLLDALRQFVLVRQEAGDACVVFDESLCGRALAFLGEHRGEPQEIDTQIFEHLPPPAGIVQLTTPPELIVQRIQHRRAGTATPKFADRHTDADTLLERTTHRIRRLGAAVEVLEQRGAHVERIDAALPTHEQVQRVAGLARRLAAEA